ncbi:unnamed protein product [Protopolystoma xenopodis]|uniref:Uncharacterized protein n=1 Tax=Protopolystoma xenopodis TaxID=117903 RepID=A0A3S5FG62_9PLAT|nr:unnamed protein product [Protopolystoma xenopodis]
MIVPVGSFCRQCKLGIFGSLERLVDLNCRNLEHVSTPVPACLMPLTGRLQVRRNGTIRFSPVLRVHFTKTNFLGKIVRLTASGVLKIVNSCLNMYGQTGELFSFRDRHVNNPSPAQSRQSDW